MASWSCKILCELIKACNFVIIYQNILEFAEQIPEMAMYFLIIFEVLNTWE